jgi:LCP family protein required for cell wall assembly
VLTHKIFAGVSVVAMGVAGYGVYAARGYIPFPFLVAAVVAVVSISLLLMSLNMLSKGQNKVRSGLLISFSALWTVVAIALGIVGGTTTAVLGDAIKDLSGGCDETSATGCNQEIDRAKPWAIYVSGMDQFGEVAEESRSDVNQLLVFDPVGKRMLMVNTPRDYYVKLHSHGPTKDKLTHAGVYGIDESRLTIADLYGIQIDYYVKINFTSLINLIDIIDGVTVKSDQAFTAFDGSKFVKGKNNLNAKQALAFARERHAFKDGDRERGRNQQKVIDAIKTKLISPQIIPRYPEILRSMKGQFLTNISNEDIEKMAQEFTSGQWDSKSTSVTGSDASEYTYTYPKQKLYVMVPNQKSLDKAKATIQEYLTPR